MKNLLHLCSLDLLTAFFLEADAPAHRHDLPSLIIQRGDHIVIDYLFYPHAPLLKCQPMRNNQLSGIPHGLADSLETKNQIL